MGNNFSGDCRIANNIETMKMPENIEVDLSRTFYIRGDISPQQLLRFLINWKGKSAVHGCRTVLEKVYEVAFSDSKVAEAFEDFGQFFLIGDTEVEQKRADPKRRRIYIHGLPLLFPEDVLLFHLKKYGSVDKLDHENFRDDDLKEIKTGIWIVCMTLEKTPPNFIEMGDFQARLSCSGLTCPCEKCSSTNHVGSTCNKTVCWNCNELGLFLASCWKNCSIYGEVHDFQVSEKETLSCDVQNSKEALPVLEKARENTEKTAMSGMSTIECTAPAAEEMQTGSVNVTLADEDTGSVVEDEDAVNSGDDEDTCNSLEDEDTSNSLEDEDLNNSVEDETENLGNLLDLDQSEKTTKKRRNTESPSLDLGQPERITKKLKNTEPPLSDYDQSERSVKALKSTGSELQLSNGDQPEKAIKNSKNVMPSPLELNQPVRITEKPKNTDPLAMSPSYTLKCTHSSIKKLSKTSPLIIYDLPTQPSLRSDVLRMLTFFHTAKLDDPEQYPVQYQDMTCSVPEKFICALIDPTSSEADWVDRLIWRMKPKLRRMHF